MHRNRKETDDSKHRSYDSIRIKLLSIGGYRRADLTILLLLLQNGQFAQEILRLINIAMMVEDTLDDCGVVADISWRLRTVG